MKASEFWQEVKELTDNEEILDYIEQLSKLEN